MVRGIVKPAFGTDCIACTGALGNTCYPAMVTSHHLAITAAQAYLDANPFPDPSYRHVLTQGRPVSDGWYFDFDYERVDGQPLGEDDLFVGAPGFIVSSRDRSVRVIGRKEWHDRNLLAG